MPIRTGDVVPLSQVRARFKELAEEVRAGREKIVTRNGESYVALIDARRLDHYHELERAHVHLVLLDEAAAGLDDVDAGRHMSVEEFRQRLSKR